jgi:hypothetical protein
MILVAKSRKLPLFDKIKRELYFHIKSKQNRRPAMSLKPQPIPEIPAETVRVVRAVFPKGNIYIHLRDTLGTIYQDELFADLYPDRGQPAYTPWRLALVTVFGLYGESDRSARGFRRAQSARLEVCASAWN